MHSVNIRIVQPEWRTITPQNGSSFQAIFIGKIKIAGYRKSLDYTSYMVTNNLTGQSIPVQSQNMAIDLCVDAVDQFIANLKFDQPC